MHDVVCKWLCAGFGEKQGWSEPTHRSRSHTTAHNRQVLAGDTVPHFDCSACCLNRLYYECDDDAQDKMIYNKITLAFPEKEEKQFLEKYYYDSLNQFRVSFVLVTFLYGIFGFLDTLMFPEYAKLFHMIRYVFVVPILSLVFFLSFTQIFQKIWQILLLVSFVVGGSGISIMTSLVPENYAYYAGLMLIFSAGYFFIKLRFFLASIAGWTTLLVFNVVAIFYSHAPDIILLTTNFFFISANIIGMFAAYNIEYYARRNFFLNRELENEKLQIEHINSNLEKLVGERTRELLAAKEEAELVNANVTAIIEGTQSDIWAFNRNYEILYINHIFQTTFHKTFGVMLSPGVNLVDSLPEKQRQAWKLRYDRVLNNEQYTLEEVMDTASGTIYIQVSFNPIVKNGVVVGGSCFGSNITQRRLSEIELTLAKEKAEESDRLKSAFLANMSHEIRTPMNGILGFSELLKNPELTGDQQMAYIAIIEKSGARMLNIINDIIDISKIEAGLIKLDLSPTNIYEQLDYIYTFFKPEADHKKLILHCKNDSSLKNILVKTDREKVYAILTNLVKNALKYCQEGSIEIGYEVIPNINENVGPLSLEAVNAGSRNVSPAGRNRNESLDKNYYPKNISTQYIENNGRAALLFYVKDTGIGIPADRQKAIFDRFVQADIEDIKARQGAGLGLSITKAYVEMLGGKIWVESEEGVGSTFYFTLPYQETADRLTNQKRSPQPTEPRPGGTVLSGLKVLLAEDDEVSQILLDIELKPFCKQVYTVTTGTEAVQICKSTPDLDLILMDIRMPEMGGYEATQKIRQFNKDVVIIAQTAFGLSGDREKALEAGCTDYISKPILREELFSLIEKYFRKSTGMN